LLVGDKSLHVVEAAEEMVKRINPKYVIKKLFKDTGAPVYKDMPEESYIVVKEFLQTCYAINNEKESI
jgi:hypothetical protein